MQSQGGEGNKIPVNDIAQSLEAFIAGTDPLRAQSLGRLQRIRKIKNTNLTREQARLSQKLGNTHPRVAETLQKIQVNQELTRNLEIEFGRTQVDIPTADPDSWILHGHVLNAKLKGVPNLTVAVYDSRGRRIEQLGYDCTDKNGHFLISYNRNRTATETFAAMGTQEGRTNQEVTVFVRVFDRNQQQLHADKRPISAKLGQVDYIRIILGENARSCPPPPSSAEASSPEETENPS
jgi:hypothetical protein